jgi:hypothetical protein
VVGMKTCAKRSRLCSPWNSAPACSIMAYGIADP